MNLGPAKGQGGSLPDHCALSCNQPLRRAQVIVDVVVQARPDFVFPKRHRLLPQPDIFPEYGAVPGNLRYQPILQIIQIVRGLRTHGLPNTTVLAVIAVAGYLLTHSAGLFSDDPAHPSRSCVPPSDSNRHIVEDKITEGMLRNVAERLNNRPRKCLHYQTSAEVFNHALTGAFAN